MKQIEVVVWNNLQAPVDSAFVELNIGPNEWQGLSTDFQGICNIFLENDYLDASHLRITKDGYVPYGQHVALGIHDNRIIRVGYPPDPNSPNDIILPPLQVLVTGLEPVTVNGLDFLVNGQRYKIKGFTDFLLLYRKAQGQDVGPILQQRKEMGVDTLRFFTMCYNIAFFDPRNYDIYNILSDLLNELEFYGLRAYCTCFADRQLLNMPDSYCLDHHGKITQVLASKGSLHFYDLVNEFEQNGINPPMFPQPIGVLSGSGSRTNNAPPLNPYWDFVQYHPRRDGDNYYFSKYLTDIPNQAEVYYGVQDMPGPALRPVIPDEPRGFGYKSGRLSDPKDGYTMGFLHTRFQNAAFFHSDQGISSELLDDTMRACCVSFVKGCDDAAQGY